MKKLNISKGTSALIRTTFSSTTDEIKTTSTMTTPTTATKTTVVETTKLALDETQVPTMLDKIAKEDTKTKNCEIIPFMYAFVSLIIHWSLLLIMLLCHCLASILRKKVKTDTDQKILKLDFT